MPPASIDPRVPPDHHRARQVTTHPIPSHGTVIVGILNLTPDSFSDGGHHIDHANAVAHARSMRDNGATLIDVGGESTRPGATPVDPRLEQDRILSVVRQLSDEGIIVSIDTRHASTARAALQLGARVINDVSGGCHDPAILDVTASFGAQYVIGHMRGTPQTMQRYAHYTDVVADTSEELLIRVDAAVSAGIPAEAIVIDPGIGFAKLPQHNWAILNHTHQLRAMGFPLMIGVSRKRFLAEALSDTSIENGDLATAVLSPYLSAHGVNAIRVHNVSATRIAMDLAVRMQL